MRKLIAIFLLASTPAMAATPCDGIWQKPLAAGQALLKKAAPQIKGLPSKPKVFEVMQTANWSLIWALVGIALGALAQGLRARST